MQPLPSTSQASRSPKLEGTANESSVSSSHTNNDAPNPQNIANLNDQRIPGAFPESNDALTDETLPIQFESLQNEVKIMKRAILKLQQQEPSQSLTTGDAPADTESTPTTNTRSSTPVQTELVLSIKRFSEEDFRPSVPKYKPHPQRTGHRIAEVPDRPLHVIEVLPRDPYKRQIHRQISRSFGRSVSDGGPTSATQVEPERIRIRSRFLLGLLEHITGSKLEHYGLKATAMQEQPSLVFLHPFKYFVTFEEAIRRYAEDLRDELTSLQTPVLQADLTTQEGELTIRKESLDFDVPLDTLTNNTTSDSEVDRGLSSQQILEYRSQKALEYIELVIQLFKEDLKGILDLRHDLVNGSVDTIAFEHLWLLYTIGELIYERNPSLNAELPPHMVRITQFSGGRPILNNSKSNIADSHIGNQPSEDSKDQENQFFIRGYYLDFDGENYGSKPTALTMPAWVGQRPIRELKLFPCRFARPKLDFEEPDVESWIQTFIARGKRYRKFGENNGISFWHYKGQELGGNKEVFDSQVVLDFLKLQQFNPETFSILKDEVDQTIQIYKRDEREVVEGAELEGTSQSGKECRVPGCDNNEIIHDDIRFTYELSKSYIATLKPSASKFSDFNEITDAEDYAIFDTALYGFVLGERRWAMLKIDLLKEIYEQRDKFDALQIKESHKRALLALIRGRIRHDFEFDSIKGKGQGVIILLNGEPGLGKTFTSEAIAAHTKRPLYPITCGDLGVSASEVERNLKRIFQLGHRWGCVLLLDEADVFLGERDRQNFERNNVVSVFLRQLEYYSGILILTTNRPETFDRALISRTHLALRYSPLSEKSTDAIFSDFIEKILSSRQKSPDPDQFQNLVKVDEKDINKWWTGKFRDAEKRGRPWWNGRQIRNAFQTAVSLAEWDAKTTEGTIRLRADHFEQVAEIYEAFQKHLSDLNDGGTEDDMMYARGGRTESTLFTLDPPRDD